MPDPLADARGPRPRKTPRSTVPGVVADARGTAPRMTPRSTVPGVVADARGTAPRMTPRSTVPGVAADACGIAPRKTSRSASPGVDADACGIAPRKTSRSALPGVDADARGTAPRKTSRPVGRGRRPRGRRPNRRRSQNYVRPSLPRLSPDSTGIDGEIALLRSLTNRLLSTRPLDYTQINRCLRLIIRAYSAQAKAPKQLTDQEQIDNLIKKVVQKSVDDGEIGIFDLLPVRKAKPGDKWWPWRDLIPLRTRREYGLIDPDDPWPHEDEEYFTIMDALDEEEKSYVEDYLFDDDEDDSDDDDDPDDDEDPPPYLPPYNHTPDDDEYPPNLTVIPDPLSVIPAEVADAPRRAGIHPSETITPNLATHPAPGPSPDCPDPNPPPRIALGRPPPLPPDHSNAPRGI